MIGTVGQRVENVPIASLRPTQLTVGMREVDYKRSRWRMKDGRQAASFLDKRRFPVVLGPGDRHYLIDRHHLALALHEEGIPEIGVVVIETLTGLGVDEFWACLEARSWTHPFDGAGRRCSYDQMPASVDALTDDPYRSLAGALKRVGGYAKDKAPFSEFRWADYLRCRIPRELVEHHFGHALALAMNLAHGREAARLPGWRRFPEETSGIVQPEDGHPGARQIAALRGRPEGNVQALHRSFGPTVA